MTKARFKKLWGKCWSDRGWSDNKKLKGNRKKLAQRLTRRALTREKINENKF